MWKVLYDLIAVKRFNSIVLQMKLLKVSKTSRKLAHMILGGTSYLQSFAALSSHCFSPFKIGIKYEEEF